MKKVIALILVLTCVFALVACTPANTTPTKPQSTTPSTTPTEPKPTTQPTEPTTTPTEPVGEGVMSYAEFVAAEMDSPVVVETYVQAHQSWWKDQITCYTQTEEGAYFLYNMACSEEDAAKLVPGTKIRVSGFKSAWSGEVEIIDATFEILEGSYIAEPVDATDLLGTEQLIEKQNQLVSFKGLTVSSIAYKNDKPGDDIYVNLTKGDVECSFCVEYYLNGSDEAFYNSFADLKEGDVVDVEGFLYWYNGANTHITSITVK